MSRMQGAKREHSGAYVTDEQRGSRLKDGPPPGGCPLLGYTFAAFR